MKCVDCVYHKAFPLTNNHWCEATKKHKRISDEDAYVDAPCKVGKRAEQTKQKVKESPSLVKDLVKAFCEDGTWLERQGVYTLTLVEAKQRAVDIIESVVTDTEQTEPMVYPQVDGITPSVIQTEPTKAETQTETQNSNSEFEKAKCPFDDPIPCEWINCPKQTDCPWK